MIDETKILGIADIYRVREPADIKKLAQDPRVDRKFDLRTCPFNWVLLKRSLMVLSFQGRLFPTVTERNSAQRQADQENLRRALNERIAAVRLGPEELEPLAKWVRGSGDGEQAGILLQQVLGRLFVPSFLASEESWAAAKVLVAAPRSWKLETAWWLLSGKVSRAKRLLAGMVDGDLSAVNAIGIAVHNVLKGVRRMRALYGDAAARSASPVGEIVEQCLFAPASLYRQATEAGQVGECRFSRNTLFVLEVGEARWQAGGSSLVFMDDTWSRCPAAEWVPAMLEGLWRRTTTVPPNQND